MTMFEKAVREKVRFTTPQGLIGVEELWDLPLSSRTGKANLDDIARGLHNKIKAGADVSFVTSVRTDSASQFQFDVVKYVIDVRLAENESELKRRENAEKKQRLLSLIASKEDAALAETSLDDLRKMVEAL